MHIRGVGIRSVVAAGLLVAVNVAAPIVVAGQASAAVNCYAYITKVKGVDTGVAHCDGSRSHRVALICHDAFHSDDYYVRRGPLTTTKDSTVTCGSQRGVAGHAVVQYS